MERHPDVDDLLPDLAFSRVLQQRPIGIVSVRHAIRVAIAVTIAWAIADLVSQSPLPLFAPVTTLLVVQTTPWTTLGISIQRILGTAIGVLVASIWVNVAGLSWWSFLAGVLAALLVARKLPLSLGGQLQIPVAVVFVLALGPGTLSADLWRVADVMIGGLIGILAVFIFPERPRPDAFERAMRVYREAIVDTLRRVGAESGAAAEPLEAGVFHDYVVDSRRFRDHADAARTALVSLAEGAYLNMRARGLGRELNERGLRLRRLSGIGVQVRGIVGAANRLYDRPGVSPALASGRFRDLSDELVTLARCVLGSADNDVRGMDVERATELDRALERALDETAADIARDPNAGSTVLQSVSLLGRLDHVRAQLAAFPGW